MTYITGHDRSQLLLLPEAVDDYVGADNPVWFIDTFVDGLDLAAAGFGRVTPKVTDRYRAERVQRVSLLQKSVPKSTAPRS